MEKIKSAPALLLAFSGSGRSEHRTAFVGCESDDSALVRKAVAGERDAFGRLYENYGAMVHGILAARVPFDEVADLTQEVFLIAFRRLETLRDVRTFGGWLATIARNRACDFHRETRRTEELDEHAAAPAVAPRAEALEALRLIQTLPESYREPLVLRLVEGMSGAEIAQRTGLTPASVRVNLHRGMRQLRQLLQETTTTL